MNSPLANIAISFVNPTLKNKAETLSQILNLPLSELNTNAYQLLLVLTEERIELRHTQEKLSPIYVDFLAGKVAHRHQFGGGRGQLIARAVGLKAKANPRVLDLTAGLGRDAFVLATLGCDVTMIERSPVVATLLQNGLDRACEQSWFQQLNLKLIQTQANEYLQTLLTKPDVIYLDPMFPDSKKTALVKKEMRILRTLVGTDKDAGDLLELALKHAEKRVVVKRSLHAPWLTEREPTLQYKGKSSRFDVYC